ncbi:BBP7 family outer membrane beta-barrel protein [Zavarzinella formosa]|uniref:BBP7 family outer membrane beta-barrel protein n=1 Tax=Zavarzinella formosa TaxID=360055 RepID=UPI0005940FD8|nr:BBP7 family outer membrane beta-barrel protein [Zavarzinella formosa]
MIRRKMWATMTCCLALAGTGQAQTDTPAKASLGKPQSGPATPGYVARGAAPTYAPGYPPGYPAPAPTYSAPVAPTGGVPGYGPAYVPPGGPQYVVQPGAAPQYAVQNGNPTPAYVPQYQPNIRAAGFASMQTPAAPQVLSAPMQMPMNTGPMPTGPMPSGPMPGMSGNPATMPGGPAISSAMPMESGGVTTVPSYNVPGSGTFGYGYPSGGDCANGNCATPMMGTIPGVMDCAPNCGPNCPLPTVWIAPEYLNWKTKGSNIPPLVTTAPRGSLGTIGLSDTRVAFGGSDMLNDWRSGVRIRGGVWLDKCEGLGLDLGYFSLAQARDRFNASSNGDPGLFRPFRTPGGAEDAQLAAFIDNTLGPILSGRIAINSTSDLMGAEANLRKVLCCDPSGRLDVLFGFRYMRLRDTLSIFEDLTATSNDPNAAAPFGTRIQVFDRFQTVNDFYGGQIGLAGEQRFGNFFFGYRGTVALGITHQKTTITGVTNTLTPDGSSSQSQGGLLALPPNIGTYNSDRFSVIPDVQLTLGYQVTKNLRVFAGYNFMYWSNVLRAGEQIDRTVNSTFIPNPGADAGTGALRPAYTRHDTGYWATGWSTGLEFRW